MKKANDSDYHSFIYDGCLIIEDKDTPGKTSVTNNIEAILSDFHKPLVDYIIYRDSMGIYDGVLVDKGFKFVEFIPLQKTTKEEAIKLLRQGNNYERR